MKGISRRRKPSRLIEKVSLPPSVVESEEVLSGTTSSNLPEATSSDLSEALPEALPEGIAQLQFTHRESSSDTSSTIEDDDDDRDPDYIDPTSHSKRGISFINEEMVGVMDTCRISSNCAVRLLIATLKVLLIYVRTSSTLLQISSERHLA